MPNPDNPFFGSIWIRNMRSKDDVPHIFRSVPWLRLAVRDAQDESVRAAARAALDHLIGFARDIVESGYHIRTIEDGVSYIPAEDLASFVTWDAVTPLGECNAKITAALVAEGEPLDNDCQGGFEQSFEDLATGINYYNYAILRYFHLSAITNALVARDADTALSLLEGLVERADIMWQDEQTRIANTEWDADMASYLLASAASGLPLTGQEARKIQTRYLAAIPHYEAWQLWDLWDASVPDGEHLMMPSRAAEDTRHIRVAELLYLIEYCASPYRNPAGVELADCEVVLDSTRWGQ